jgi:hypothetical protein
MQHGTQCIPNSLVGTFPGGVLVGGITTSGPDYVATKEDQIIHFLMVSKFTPLARASVFVSRIPRTILTEPSVQPVEWGGAYYRRENPTKHLWHDLQRSNTLFRY